MRLIVHIGLHKTGSTYLQHIMNDNHEALKAAGVYYERQPGYPAHHFAAWDILRGDASSVARIVADARVANCQTVILSSEDLEGVIFDQSAAEGIEVAADAADVETVEWHMCVRDSGQYFSSLYAQLQHHVFADPASMLWEVLRDGMIMIIDPLRGGPGTPFWCYCFDHDRYVSAFAEQTAHPVFLHDFRDREPFPGWGILEAAGALKAVSVLPGDDARNRRLRAETIRLGYSDQILRLLPDEAMRGRLEVLLNDQLGQNGAAVDDYAAIVGERFAASTAAALARFGYRAEQPLRAVG